nr:hypothetical protein [Pandoravirus massiliensis]
MGVARWLWRGSRGPAKIDATPWKRATAREADRGGRNHRGQGPFFFSFFISLSLSFPSFCPLVVASFVCAIPRRRSHTVVGRARACRQPAQTSATQKGTHKSCRTRRLSLAPFLFFSLVEKKRGGRVVREKTRDRITAARAALICRAHRLAPDQ